MDAICTFMDEGRISLDEAVQYVGMEMDELEEIFENWKWFCENEEGGWCLTENEIAVLQAWNVCRAERYIREQKRMISIFFHWCKIPYLYYRNYKLRKDFEYGREKNWDLPDVSRDAGK